MCRSEVVVQIQLLDQFGAQRRKSKHCAIHTAHLSERDGSNIRARSRSMYSSNCLPDRLPISVDRFRTTKFPNLIIRSSTVPPHILLIAIQILSWNWNQPLAICLLRYWSHTPQSASTLWSTRIWVSQVVTRKRAHCVAYGSWTPRNSVINIA